MKNINAKSFPIDSLNPTRMQEYSMIKGITKLEVCIFFNFGAPRRQKQTMKHLKIITEECCTYSEK